MKGVFPQRLFGLVIRKAQVPLILFTMANFYEPVQGNIDKAKWNPAIVHFLIFISGCYSDMSKCLL